MDSSIDLLLDVRVLGGEKVQLDQQIRSTDRQLFSLVFALCANCRSSASFFFAGRSSASFVPGRDLPIVEVQHLCVCEKLRRWPIGHGRAQRTEIEKEEYM